MTGGMMGRTSDTRMYAPRSESSHMFRANHEDERTPTGNEDPRDKEAKMDKRQKKKEMEEKEDKKIRHIKVRRHHIGIGKPNDIGEEGEEESEFKPRESPSEPTQPAGAGGFLTSLAMGAKGPGAAGGQSIQMSEPMNGAWSTLLKETRYEAIYGEEGPGEYDAQIHPPNHHNALGLEGKKCPECNQISHDLANDGGAMCLACRMKYTSGPKHASEPMNGAWSSLLKEQIGDRAIEGVPHITWMSPEKRTGWVNGNLMMFGLPQWAASNKHTASISTDKQETPQEHFMGQMFDEQGNLKSEPMEHAWSSLLKSKRKKEKRSKTEERAKWRPSTGKFKRPRGGYTGRSGTSARAKLLSRNLPMGRKTGLMRAHPSVEFSHRGIASKQPMSKDPQAYGQWKGYQEQQNIMGQVRPISGARLPMGQVNMPRAPRPRLHPVRAPPIQPPRLRAPSLNRPKMPGMVTMSEDPVPEGGLLKGKGQNPYLLAEARQAIIALKKLMREVKDKDSKKKGKGTPDTSGASSNLPNHPANNPKQTTNPEGPTESDTDARQFGLDPRGVAGGSGRV